MTMMAEEGERTEKRSNGRCDGRGPKAMFRFRSDLSAFRRFDANYFFGIPSFLVLISLPSPRAFCHICGFPFK